MGAINATMAEIFAQLGVRLVIFENCIDDTKIQKQTAKAEQVHNKLTDASVDTKNTTTVPVEATKEEMPRKLSVVTTVEHTVGSDSPNTATDDLFFGSNKFTSKEIIVAPGYFVTVHLDNSAILNLFLIRTRDAHMRVAQIGVDGFFNPIKNKNQSKKDREIIISTGVHKMRPNSDGEYPLEFYFLSKSTY